MIIELTARHGTMNEDLKEHAQAKLEHALKHVDSVVSAHVVLDYEKDRQIAEIIVHGRNLTATVHAEAGDAWSSVDRATEKLRHQIDKHHAKRRSRQRRGLSHEHQAEAEMKALADMQAEMEKPEPPPTVVRTQLAELANFSIAEACTELGTTDEEVLLFREAQTGLVSVLFRREDGELALIEAQS